MNAAAPKKDDKVDPEVENAKRQAEAEEFLGIKADGDKLTYQGEDYVKASSVPEQAESSIDAAFERIAAWVETEFEDDQNKLMALRQIGSTQNQVRGLLEG